MNTIVHIKYSYLPLSETFIYVYLQNIKNYRYVVVSIKRENQTLFLHDDVYSLSDLNFFKKTFNYFIQKGT